MTSWVELFTVMTGIRPPSSYPTDPNRLPINLRTPPTVPGLPRLPLLKNTRPKAMILKGKSRHRRSLPPLQQAILASLLLTLTAMLPRNRAARRIVQPLQKVLPLLGNSTTLTPAVPCIRPTTLLWPADRWTVVAVIGTKMSIRHRLVIDPKSPRIPTSMLTFVRDTPPPPLKHRKRCVGAPTPRIRNTAKRLLTLKTIKWTAPDLTLTKFTSLSSTSALPRTLGSLRPSIPYPIGTHCPRYSPSPASQRNRGETPWERTPRHERTMKRPSTR